MSKYAKKKIATKVRPKKRKVKQPSDQINMNSSNRTTNVRKTRPSNSKSSSFLRLRGFMVSAVVLVLLFGGYIITLLLHPVGVLEYVSNSLSTIGTGKYPASLNGGDTLQVEKQNNSYFVLSNTNIDVFGNGGKQIFTSQHGFLKPVLKTSDVRFLIYDQGGKILKFTITINLW